MSYLFHVKTLYFCRRKIGKLLEDELQKELMINQSLKIKAEYFKDKIGKFKEALYKLEVKKKGDFWKYCIIQSVSS